MSEVNNNQAQDPNCCRYGAINWLISSAAARIRSR